MERMKKVRNEPGFNVYLPDGRYEELKKALPWGELFRTIHQLICEFNEGKLKLKPEFNVWYNTKKCSYRRLNLPLKDWMKFRKKIFPSAANHVLAGLIEQHLKTLNER